MVMIEVIIIIMYIEINLELFIFFYLKLDWKNIDFIIDWFFFEVLYV